ncbi:MAG: hypothetical protein WBQ08_21140 [Candidatus Sulfotelmatobacter sp.]
MKRQITGLHAADRCAADQVLDGVFLPNSPALSTEPFSIARFRFHRLLPRR